MTESELIQRCIANERQAQEQLYRKHFATMMAMCMRYTSDSDEAMQIVNAGMLRVFQKLATFEAKGSFEGWIRRIVFHAVSDHFKKEKSYLQFMVFEEHDTSQAPDVLQKNYVEDIMLHVNRLPTTTQSVFKMYAIEGYSHIEIGKALNISDGTSKWHLSSARHKLQTWLTETTDYEAFRKK